jgi:hypothetical protein
MTTKKDVYYLSPSNPMASDLIALIRTKLAPVIPVRSVSIKTDHPDFVLNRLFTLTVTFVKGFSVQMNFPKDDLEDSGKHVLLAKVMLNKAVDFLFEQPDVKLLPNLAKEAKENWEVTLIFEMLDDELSQMFHLVKIGPIAEPFVRDNFVYYDCCIWKTEDSDPVFFKSAFMMNRNGGMPEAIRIFKEQMTAILTDVIEDTAQIYHDITFKTK